MAPGGPEQAPGWLMKAMGGVGQPTNDLSLRFPMLLGHRTLWAYVFQCFGALGRSRLTPVQRNRPEGSKVGPPNCGFSWRLRPVREPSEGGLQVPL